MPVDPCDTLPTAAFDFCRQFVITVALRLTEISARAVPPSWT
ncbi:hypothetical protein OG819_49535 [Streptomyces sp. NBC_01549]|nr:hypothetical protein [Streptomyces sp. NBC_01549]MCX4597347.1 hypothetical protein [Streptomyces sp. NBC_01549]